MPRPLTKRRFRYRAWNYTDAPDPALRHTVAARTIARRVLAAPAHESTHLCHMLAGHLLKVCEATGETGGHVMRRLRLSPIATTLMRKAGGKALASLLAIHKPARLDGCVRGRRCECTSIAQRTRCGNWHRSDPSATDLTGGPCDEL